MDEWEQSAFYLIAAAAGGVLGYFLARIKEIYEIRKLKEEITKLKKESIEKAQVVIEKIQKARREYDAASSDLAKCVQDFQKSITAESASKEKQREERDKICDILCAKALPRFIEFCEIVAPTKSRGELMSFCEKTILSEMNRISAWIQRILNHRKLLRLLSAKPLVLSASTFEPLRDVIKQCDNKSLSSQFNSIVEKLYREDES